MSEKDFELKPAKPEDIPTRGKWKRIVLKLIKKFDDKGGSPYEVIGFHNKKEMMSLYDAFKALIKKTRPDLEIKMKDGKLFLLIEEN